MKEIMKEAIAIEEELIQIRRFIHRNAEIGFDLDVTKEYVKDKLVEYGYKPREICKSGIVAEVSGGKGKTILLRADMDALDMDEDNDLEFKSETEYAHNCGHDLHTAMLLGAAKIIKVREKDLRGTIKFMFQPDEEGGKGALAMIDAGVLENPSVDGAFAIHVDATSPLGQIEYGKGPTFASCDNFTIEIHGNGGHGARPNQTIDPINIAVRIHSNLQRIISSEVKQDETCVLNICQIESGTNFNVMPDKAIMKGTIRTYSQEERDLIVERLEEIVHLTCKTFRGKGKVTLSNSLPLVYCDEEMTDIVIDGLVDKYEEGYVNEVPIRIIGSEDFGYITKKVPSVHISLGAGRDFEKGGEYGHHNPKVFFNEKCIYIGAGLYSWVALEYLRKC